MGLLDCFRVFVAGCLVLGKEVCTVLATSNRLQETALLCIGIGELTSAGWITRGLQTWPEWANGNDRFGYRHTQTGEGDGVWIRGNRHVGKYKQR